MKHEHPELVALVVFAVLVVFVALTIVNCDTNARIGDLEQALTPVAERER